LAKDHRKAEIKVIVTDASETAKTSQVLSPKTQAILLLTQGLLPALTGIIGGLWLAFTYIDKSHKETIADQATAAKEINYKIYESAYKPLLDRRDLDCYRIGEEIGKVLSEPVSSAEWESAHKKFLSLYWGGAFSVFRDGPTHDTAASFIASMEKYKKKQDPETRNALEKDASELINKLTWFIDWEKTGFLEGHFEHLSEKQNR
jgi:hypothetical protein